MNINPTYYKWPTESNAFVRFGLDPRFHPADTPKQAAHHWGLMSAEFEDRSPQVIAEEMVEQTIYHSPKRGGSYVTKRWLVHVLLDETRPIAPPEETRWDILVRAVLRRPAPQPIRSKRIERFYSLSASQWKTFNEIIDRETP